MKHLLGPLPAIVLGVFITAGNIGGFRLPLMRPLCIAGFVLMALVLYVRQREGGLSAIDRGFLVYMGFNGVAFWVFPQSLGPLATNFPTGVLYTVLFIEVAAPAFFMKQYFTEFYARKSIPQAIRETDIYTTINRHMTWVWAALFAISAFVTAIPYLFDMGGNLLTGMSFQVILPAALMLGVGIPFNKKYPEYYKHKMGIEALPSEEDSPKEARHVPAKPVDHHDKEKIMNNQLRVVAINGSPHGAVGNTSQMIQMIAPTLAQEGIHLEEVLLVEKRIEYCMGCAVCLEKGRCWRPDDYAGIVNKLLAADGIILASPVYFGHVTAQTKTFIDRSLGYGHKPRRTWKPGLAISVSGGKGETDTVRYLARSLNVYGAFSVGTLTAIATNPGAFLGKELVEARAQDLARDLIRAIKEKRQCPATDEGLSFYLFMKELVTRQKDFMLDDYQYWQENRLFDGFEAFTNQQFSPTNFDPEVRKEWLREIIQEDKLRNKGQTPEVAEKGKDNPCDRAANKVSAESCLELLQIMPLGFKSGAAQGLTAVFQFEITGSEEFTAHLKIADNECTFHEGPHGKPDVVIKSPANVWLAISRGEMNGQTAFMSGKYKVDGNIGLMMKLKSLFG